jgi:hypothetical protein
MIRQFTIVPALLAGAAMIISACSAEIGGSSEGSGSGSSNSSSQSATGGSGSIAGKIERALVVYSALDWGGGNEDQFAGSFLLEDGSLVEKWQHSEEYFSPVDLKNIKYIPNFQSHSYSQPDYSMCALTDNSEVHCWGTNEYGTVGNGTYESSFKQKEKICKNGSCSLEFYKYESFKILSDVESLISPQKNTYCALNFNGNASCWGKNNGFDASGVTMVNTPVPVDASQYQFTEASAKIVKVEYSEWGKDTSCEITDAGKVACQGYNSDEGMLFGKENKGISNSVIPIEITGIEKAQSFVEDSAYRFTNSLLHIAGLCLLREDDKIQCWGDLLEDGVLTYTP